ncbi:S8 family peptidase [Desulfitobacterium hafniense]|uniref:S8 family peptidase n=1 Tax=Desulfitobacterium hafniense TaxID=49338 RepID=UPI00036660C7|nr:S8 family peptidase [Desulfitobacterium hafniense]
MAGRPERPIILFGRPNPANRNTKNGGPSKISIPPHSRQAARLEPKLAALQDAIDNNRILLQQSPTGIQPEKTLVFEVSGDLKSFYTAVKNLGHGVEWIFDTSADIAVSDDFFVCKENKSTKTWSRDDAKASFSGKVYCVLANSRALEEMVSLWKRYAQNPNMIFPRNKTGLRDVFRQLIDIHFWGYKERLEETGVLEAWQEDLELEPELSMVRCEIELFYRKSKVIQQQRENSLAGLVREAGGRILARTVIDAIHYHALLAELPRQIIQDIIAGRDVAVASAEQIMFFKTVGQSVVIANENIADSTLAVSLPSAIDDEPVIALFDGLPQENHPYLDGLLNIDDPDDYASHYTVPARKHGTSMASLIAHGDLNNIKHQVTHRIYVRPIMKSMDTLNGTGEEIPGDILIVDKIHEAIRRLFEPDAGRVAPSVRVINFSIGAESRLFDRLMSPLARLLDWLSYKYRVLFIVSAGNHLRNIDVEIAFTDFSGLTEEKRDAVIIRHLNNNARLQRLLSPAESINALTVGAAFCDESVFTLDIRQVLPCSDGMVSPISALGRGLNNSIKPDIIFDGGRNTLLQDPLGGTNLRWRQSLTRAPGTVSAAPFNIASSSEKIMYSYGTSNAAALTSHEASRCYDILVDVFDEAGELLPYDYAALLINAMLVHGAEWGELFEKFNTALGNPKWTKDYLHKFFGYGKPNIEKAIECARNRITLIGYGELKDGQAHLFDLPLPFEEFSRQKILRRLTVTMASFCPITPSRQAYRSAHLWFTVEGAKEHLIGKRINADAKAVIRGSLQHEIFENDRIVFWSADDSIQLKVNCVNVADESFRGSVPYALMVSFEIDNAVDIDVYTRVATKIKPRITASSSV